MTSTQKAVADILALPTKDRAQLLSVIWDSLADAEEAVPVPDWHLRVIDERLDADDADQGDGEDWADVRRRIESKP